MPALFNTLHGRITTRLTFARCPSWSGTRWALLRRSQRHQRINGRSETEVALLENSCQRRCYTTGSTFEPVVQWPTIYALSTGAGRAAIAVVRVSGPACREVYHALCPNTTFPRARHATLRSLFDPYLKNNRTALLDSNALVLFFPSPKSVTGEDVLELHIHGGSAVITAVLAAISKCSLPAYPIRYAEPGEFTRRAFVNDRLDLPQIEALGDTLAAITEEQRRIAVQGTNGSLATRYESWRQLLLSARGELEALIDFSEDQHFDESPSALASSIAAQVKVLQEQITLHIANALRGELLRNGILLAFLGAPNAGKSSLLNQLVGRDAAIVSHEAGTTRDVVEVGLDIGGFFVRLSDTAGLRGLQPVLGERVQAQVGDVEREGIRRAKARAYESDVIVLMLSLEPGSDGQVAQLHFEHDVISTANELLGLGKTVLAVINKTDRLGVDNSIEQRKRNLAQQLQRVLPALPLYNVFFTSCKDAITALSLAGDTDPDVGGIRPLVDGLVAMFRQLTTVVGSSGSAGAVDTESWHEALGATARQSALLQECRLHLESFLRVARYDGDLDSSNSGGTGDIPDHATQSKAFPAVNGIVQAEDESEVDIVAAAEDLRAAAMCLSRITGRGEAGDVEEVLGVVFEKFCVGK